MRPLRSLPALLAAALAAPLPAQSLSDASARIGYQWHYYELGGAIDRQISQLVVPVALVLPMGSRLTFDLATAYARSTVNTGGTISRVEGPTDVQLRGAYTLGQDAVILTAGVNLPTGQSTVTEEQIDAAGQIGSDFLIFPISSMGTGLSGTGGIAVARPLGSWNVGFGASMRYSAEYEPFEVQGQTVHYQPGTEYRGRFGADRAIGAGRFALGVTYSAFADDAAGEFTYNTGDRYMAEAGYAATVDNMELSLSVWNLLRTSGQTATQATTPWENIANVSLRAGFRVGLAVIEPNAELRTLSRDTGPESGGGNAGRLALLGLRTRLDFPWLTITPSAGIATGNLKTPTGASTDVTGWRAAVTIRNSR